MEQKPTEQPKKEGISPWVAMEIVWDLIITVAVPTVIFALLGRWLDQRYNTGFVFLVIGLVLALLVVTKIILKKGRAIAKRL